MTISQILLIAKWSSITVLVGYILFLYLSRKNLKKTLQEKENIIVEKDKRIAMITNQVELLTLNVKKLKDFAAKNKEITENTNTVIKLIEDNEVSDEEKDKAVADMLDTLSTGSKLRNR